MKKLFAYVLAFLPSVTFAESVQVGDITYYYRVIGDGVEIANPYDLGGSWPQTPLGDDFAVPETIDGKPVVSIGDNAFGGANVNSLSVPDSVTNIGVSAIGGAGISEFKIPSKLVRIGARAFSGCGYLTELELPSSLKIIEEGAFSASGLTKLSLPDGITEIPPDMCDGCSSLREIHIPESVTNIGWRAFYGTGLTSLEFPDGVEVIEEMTCANCFDLNELYLPSKVKVIRRDAFSGCQSLWGVSIPNTIEVLEEDAFYECGSAIENVEISSKMAVFDFSAFRHTQVYHVKILSEDTFITRTESWSGNDWVMVSEVTVPWPKVQELLDALTVTWDYGGGTTSTFWHGPQILTVTGEVEEIPDYMFEGRGCFEAFIFPEGLKRIGKHAFDNCWNMTATYLPKTLEAIDDYAFLGCNNFAIGWYWIDQVVDDGVVIPASVKYIGHHAFHPTDEYTETSCRKFIFEGKPPEVDPEAFTNTVYHYNSVGAAPFTATAGYYLPMYEKEWLAVIDENGEYGGLPMHRADADGSTQYLELNGVRWPYYIEDGKAVIGFYDGVGNVQYSIFYGSASVIKKFNGELVVPSEIGGYSVKRIDNNTIRWEAPITSVTIPASVKELEPTVTMFFPYNGKPSRIRFCGLPPTGLEKSNLITDANLYEYPLSKEAAWLAFFEENGITVNAIPYDDSGDEDVQDYTGELKVSAMAYAGIYDGNPHTISVKVEGEYEMLAIEYATSPRGPYKATPPTFTSVCEGQAVHYRVMAKDCRPVYGYELVTIYQDLGLVTVKTPVPVPIEWLKAVYKLGNNANFEAAAQRYTGKVDPVLGPLQAWQEYVMGTDPSDPDSRFLVGLEPKEDGGFRVTWSPDKSNEHHIYTILGKRSLTDSEWTVIPDPENPPEGFCFFGAKVDLDDYMMGLLKAQRPAVHFAGDVDGDGEVTNADLTKLKNYLTYLNQIKSGLASDHLSHDWNLTADELDAADVNGDGVVDRDDEKALKNIIKGK